MIKDIRSVIAAWIPRHVEKQCDGIFHRLEVADIEYPQTVDTVFISQPHLLPHVLHGRAVEQLAVAGRTHVIHVIIHAPASGVLTLTLVGQTAHIAPVVVTQQQCHIVGHPEPGVVIIKHLLVQCPHLRCLRRLAAGHFADNFSLIFYHRLEQFHVGLRTHGLVAVAAHAYSHHILGILHALHSFSKKSVEHTLVGLIIPGSVLLALAGPFLMVPGHRLVM